MGDSCLFAVYIHHDGKFLHLEGADVYVGGECEGAFDLDKDKFGYFDAEELVEKLGYVSWEKIWFKIPKSESYRVLKNDNDVMQMLSLLTPENRVLHFFVEGCKRDESGTKSKANTKADRGLKGNNVGVQNEADNISNVDDLVSENEFSDDYSEDSDFNPCGGEESDDELDDSELASDDEEYVKARQKVKKVKTKQDIFDLLDEEQPNGMGFNMVFEHNESDYASSDGEVNSDSTDEDGENPRSNKFRSTYDPRIKPKDLQIKLGMRFSDGFQCRDALRDNAIAHQINIKFDKVTKTVCQAKCRPPCPWKLYASLVQADDYFYVKTYYPTHKCRRKTNNKLMSAAWIAEHYMNIFRVHPNLPINILAEKIRKKYLTIPGKDRLYRARAIAQNMIRGSVEQHYALLRRYVAELIRLDRDGRYLLLLGEGAVFKGLYIGHSALRNGFKKGCRPVIGLDGCFLKTYLGGILLVAVGKDGNNQMFPIAWAIVEIENEECWTWFLNILLEDLAITDGNRLCNSH